MQSKRISVVRLIIASHANVNLIFRRLRVREHDITVHPPQMELEGDLMISTEKTTTNDRNCSGLLNFWCFFIHRNASRLQMSRSSVLMVWWGIEMKNHWSTSFLAEGKEARKARKIRHSHKTIESAFSHLHDVWNKLSSGRIPRSAIKSRDISKICENFFPPSQRSQTEKESEN